jgi:cytosine deaminase/tRNA(adenine34) deaminase
MIESFLNQFVYISQLHPKEIPSFTQVYLKGRCIAESYNLVEEKTVTHMHSEILCIEAAQKVLNTKFLKDCVLLTAIEPCLMCAGCIINARIKEVIYFLGATKTEGITSLSIESIYTKNHFPKLTLQHSGEVESIVKGFFKDKR